MADVYRLLNLPELAAEKFCARYLGEHNVPTNHHEIRHLNNPPRETPLIIPDELKFAVNEELITDIDWIPTDSGHDIFSNKLINAICDAGTIDCTLISAQLFSTEGKLVFENRFKCVLYNEYLDCFDYENSEYKPGIWKIMDPAKVTDRMRKNVGAINKFVLKEPKNGFPPVFRLLAHPTELLISSDCHDAIVKAKLNVRLHKRDF